MSLIGAREPLRGGSQSARETEAGGFGFRAKGLWLKGFRIWVESVRVFGINFGWMLVKISLLSGSLD